MKIKQTLIAWALCTWSASAQTTRSPCGVVTVTRVAQIIPCATVSTLIIASGLSGDLELDGIIEVGDFSMLDNEGLDSLRGPSLSRIERTFTVARAASLETIILPRLTNVTEILVEDAPSLFRITLGSETSSSTLVEYLTVTNTAVTELNFHLDSVGDLTIMDNPYLTNFFSPLQDIFNGTFDFNGELLVTLPNLVSAVGLSFGHTIAVLLWSLVYVNSTLTITNNDFRHLDGGPDSLHLPLLESVGFGLTLVNNTSLVDVKFPRLQTVGRYLSIENNSAVVRLDFPHLNKVNGNFTVADNPAIADLGGFPELTEVSEKAVLKGNFVYVELPKLSNAGGGLFITSSQNINDRCAALKETFQSQRTYQAFECQGADGGTGSADPNPDPPEAPTKSLSGGAIAGIIIGTLAAVGILAAVLFIIWRRRRKQAVVEETTSATEIGDNRDSKYMSVPPDELQGVPRSEIASPEPELEGSRMPKDRDTIYYEVDGTTRGGA